MIDEDDELDNEDPEAILPDDLFREDPEDVYLIGERGPEICPWNLGLTSDDYDF